MPYTQANRPFAFGAAIGQDVLMLTAFSGDEWVSRPFSFSLELFSENTSIKAADVLGKWANIKITLGGGGERFIHGFVSRFAQLQKKEGVAAYRVELVPQIWFLSLAADCRIYQNKSVPDILQLVFKEFGISDVDVRLQGSFAPREYCVQYRETYLDFISRLMEEEGIFYFFEHEEKKHTLVLANAPSAVTACPDQAKARMSPQAGRWQDEDVVLGITFEQAVHTAKVSLTDYNFETPSLSLMSSGPTSSPGFGSTEVYDYPGKYEKIPEGERYAKLGAQTQEALHKTFRGESNCRAFVTGKKFDLAEHYRADFNGPYMLTHIWHSASAGDYRAWNAGTVEYRNDFACIPMGVSFRPARVTPRPIVHGTQTAVVVGPAGEEIYTDKYGRVKVQFFWDRLGKKDDKSSCWVRVSSTWAGKQWGFIQIPRIGQEVIVDFLEGDPDRPIITGRVYNAEMMPPYQLPDNKTQSGTKSRSSRSGTPANFNEIRMEDKKGSEQLFLHAEKNQDIEVENDETHWVGHDRAKTIDHDETSHIKHDRTETVDNDETITIGGNRTESVAKDETISITGKRSEDVGKDETINIGGHRTETVSKNESITVSGNRSTSVGKNEELNVAEKRTMSIGKDDTLTVGKKLVIDAADEISLTTGDASIVMKKNGTITIKGKDIMIQGSGKINVKADGDVILKGSKVAAN